MRNFTVQVSAALRRLVVPFVTARARLSNRAFCCAALAGKSRTNLVINSDLTVSCSCHDVDGSGRLADLREQSLAEILAGPTARRFRETLAQGRLPTPLCVRCRDLRTVPRPQAARLADQHRLPTFVAMENTSACNLRCTSCPRHWIRHLRARPSMSLDDVRRVADELHATGISSLGYLNFGEPFLSKNIRRELEIIRQANPELRIHTSTNALPLDSDEKREAALLVDEMQISLDGIDQRTAERYQRGTDFQRAYQNMKALVQYRHARGLARPVIIWKYLLFRWNDRREYLLRAVELGRAAGVDEVLFEKTVSPVSGISWRWRLGLLDGVGERCEGGMRVDLRSNRTRACEVASDRCAVTAGEDA